MQAPNAENACLFLCYHLLEAWLGLLVKHLIAAQEIAAFLLYQNVRVYGLKIPTKAQQQNAWE